VVDVQTTAVKMDTAVLTRVLVTLKDIVPREFDLFFWQPVKQAEHDDSGNPYSQRDGLQHPRFRIADGKVTPACEVVREEIACSVIGDDLCVALIEEGQGPSGRTGVDRLPQPVEYKYRLIEQIIHDGVCDASMARTQLASGSRVCQS